MDAKTSSRSNSRAGRGGGQRPATTGPAPIRLSSNENLSGPEPQGDRGAQGGSLERSRPRLSAGPRRAISRRPLRRCGAPSRQRHDGDRVRRGIDRRRDGLLPDREAAGHGGSVIRLTGADRAAASSSRSSRSRSTATCILDLEGWSRASSAPASCSCAIRTTRRRPSKRRRMSNRPCATSRRSRRTTGDPDRRGVHRLRHRSRCRHGDEGRSRCRTCSWRGRSRRPTAWPACASATRSASPRRCGS